MARGYLEGYDEYKSITSSGLYFKLEPAQRAALGHAHDVSNRKTPSDEEYRDCIRALIEVDLNHVARQMYARWKGLKTIRKVSLLEFFDQDLSHSQLDRKNIARQNPKILPREDYHQNRHISYSVSYPDIEDRIGTQTEYKPNQDLREALAKQRYFRAVSIAKELGDQTVNSVSIEATNYFETLAEFFEIYAMHSEASKQLLSAQFFAQVTGNQNKVFELHHKRITLEKDKERVKELRRNGPQRTVSLYHTLEVRVALEEVAN